MNNEPVAWITPDNLEILKNEYGEEVLVRNKDYYTYEIPLYTHPVKELTDEEILDIWYAMEDDSNNWTRYVEFARAILRKAQE